MRERVVEILRSAADWCTTLSDSALSIACADLGYSYYDVECHFALRARLEVLGPDAETFDLDPEVYRAALLEAARRVEEGYVPLDDAFRAEVVEFLRCGADLDSLHGVLMTTEIEIERTEHEAIVHRLAVIARQAVESEDARWVHDYVASCLEAAQRLEDGEELCNLNVSEDGGWL
jgi:hypothetical protein